MIFVWPEAKRGWGVWRARQRSIALGQVVWVLTRNVGLLHNFLALQYESARF